MESTKPKKRTPRTKKARALLVVAAGLTLGAMAANGCADGGSTEPDMATRFVSNDMKVIDFGNPVDMERHD